MEYLKNFYKSTEKIILKIWKIMHHSSDKQLWIMVKIGPQNHLLVGRRYKAYRSILQTRPQNRGAVPTYRCGTIKIPPCMHILQPCDFTTTWTTGNKQFFKKILRPIVTIIVNWLLVRFFFFKFNSIYFTQTILWYMSCYIQ